MKDLRDGRVASPPGSTRSAPEAAARLRPAGDDPSRWPSGAEVLAELKRRNPNRYKDTRNFGYTPGHGPPATIAQIADQVEAVDREMADPVLFLAGQLDGEAFLMEDSAILQTDTRTMLPVEETNAERRAREVLVRRASLMRRASEMLREMRRDSDRNPEGGDREDGLRAEHESAGPEGIAQ